MHDLIIRNAQVYDGLGGPPLMADVAVSKGRITHMGHVEGPARDSIDAQGLALMPGIVDLHTHYDAQLFWDPYATPSNVHGVTSVIGGNCGFTIAPIKAEDADGKRLDARPRILITGCPIGGAADKVVRLIEEHGGWVVGYENCTGAKAT